MVNLTDRIIRLKEKSLNAEVWIDPERAQIVTDLYSKNAGKYSIPVLRARSFKNLMAKKELYLGDEELIVSLVSAERRPNSYRHFLKSHPIP